MSTYSSITLTLAALLLATTSLLGETRHLHVLKIIDSRNENPVLRDGARSVEYGLDQEIRFLQDRLGILNIIEYEISGADFTRERLDEVIEYEMEYLERDIVVVLYVGHGYRPVGSAGLYPHLYFGDYTSSIDFADVQARILEKNPSMLLNIVLACNATQMDFALPPPFEPDNVAPPVVTLKAAGIRRTEPYQQLFADQDGFTKVVDLVSSDREYYTFLASDGGIFFNEIRYTFQWIFGDTAPRSWSEVCERIQQKTVERSQARGLIQQPICSYSVWRNPVTVAVKDLPDKATARRACAQQLRSLRKQQRQALKDLRRRHREAERVARQAKQPREYRRLQTRENRVELEQLKLRHQQAYLRQRQQC
jgi:hypothetical protein